MGEQAPAQDKEVDVKDRWWAAVLNCSVAMLALFSSYLVVEFAWISRGQARAFWDAFQAPPWAWALILLIAFVFGILPWSFAIYHSDPAHLERRVLWRWAMLGLLLGPALQGIRAIVPSETGKVTAWQATVRHILSIVLAGIALYGGYWLVFRLPSRLTGGDYRDGPGS